MSAERRPLSAARPARERTLGAAHADRHEGYVSSDEAAAMLDVKRETLYAYASRGLVRSVTGPRGRARLSARSDLERLRARHDARAGHAAVAASALRWGEPVLESAITEITARGPRTRGVVLADQAAGGVTFEDLAALVWGAADPPARGAAPPDRDAERALACAHAVLSRQRGGRLLDRLVLANTALGVLDGGRFVSAREAELARAWRLLRVLAASLALPDRRRAVRVLRGSRPLAVRVLEALGLPDDDATSRRAIDGILVALADHELNASTFATRVAASAGADLYACLSAGLATVSGPRHGGACDRVEQLVREAASPRGADGAVCARLARGEAIAGFGHPLYPTGDPRARPLLEIAARLVRGRARPAPSRAAARTLLAIVERVAARGGEPPSVDVGSVAITLALGAPPGTSTALFALGRTVGWVAHALEQRESAALLRPRARFIGPAPVGSSSGAADVLS
ncbi:MAG: citrate synthase family protein [Deltaproteobacteria bacterium]